MIQLFLPQVQNRQQHKENRSFSCTFLPVGHRRLTSEKVFCTPVSLQERRVSVQSLPLSIKDIGAAGFFSTSEGVGGTVTTGTTGGRFLAK